MINRNNFKSWKSNDEGTKHEKHHAIKVIETFNISEYATKDM